MSIDYAQLAALAAVVREGSFEAAARSLHVTPSAVSQRIKQLEERQGGVLVTRGQPCRPTPAGAALCRHAERVALLEAELDAGLAAGSTRPGGPGAARATLRIAVNADSLATWFVDAMARFTAAHALLLDVSVDDQDHTAEALREGSVLAAVTALAAPVAGCRSLPLGRLRYRATASPAFVARHFAQGVTATALAGAPCLRFNRKDQLQARWVRNVCRREVALPSHWLPSSQAFVDACVAGLGWGLNPLALVEPLLGDGRLVELAPRRHVDVPLYWQHTRLDARVLEGLTAAVLAAARDRLAA
jgi:LysR family transcriptional regulator (chromosome initiation inhibitor)